MMSKMMKKLSPKIFSYQYIPILTNHYFLSITPSSIRYKDKKKPRIARQILLNELLIFHPWAGPRKSTIPRQAILPLAIPVSSASRILASP
jgi:hypothetical protein